MPFNEAELKSWLGTLGLTEEQQKVVAPVFSNEKIAEKVIEQHKGALRREDHSRLMNELSTKEKKLQADFDRKMQEVEKYEGDLGTWKKDNEPKLQVAERKAADALSKLQAVQQQMTKLAEDYAIPPDALPKFEAAPVNLPANNNGGGSGGAGEKPSGLTREDLQKELQPYPFIMAEMNDILGEHFELFGKPLRGTQDIVAEALKQKRPLREIWTEKHNVEARRKEIADAARAAEVEQIRKEERTKLMSEMKLDASNMNPQYEAPNGPVAAIAKKEKPAPNRGAASSPDAVAAAMRMYMERRANKVPMGQEEGA